MKYLETKSRKMINNNFVNESDEKITRQDIRNFFKNFSR
jgi:hypothetical protein